MKLTVEIEDHIDFPAFTICNESPLLKDAIEQEREFVKGLSIGKQF